MVVVDAVRQEVLLGAEELGAEAALELEVEAEAVGASEDSINSKERKRPPLTTPSTAAPRPSTSRKTTKVVSDGATGDLSKRREERCTELFKTPSRRT